MRTTARSISAPRGTTLSCKGWPQEAALRMLMNNLDPAVAENPDELIVYGGTGKAARNWESFDAIVATLRRLENDETLIVQSGKPVAVFRTHTWAPRVLIANALLVPAWATWEKFRDLEDTGLTMYGQMPAGSWIYIGTQGILQGTYETLAAVGRRHFGGSLSGRLVDLHRDAGDPPGHLRDVRRVCPPALRREPRRAARSDRRARRDGRRAAGTPSMRSSRRCDVSRTTKRWSCSRGNPLPCSEHIPGRRA